MITAAPRSISISAINALEPQRRGPLIYAGRPLDNSAFIAIRRRAILEGCKWDPQVGDVSTLAGFPLVVNRETWTELATTSEQLTSETLAAEQEILSRPDLLKQLGFPNALRKALSLSAEPTPAAARTMRFDFHPTSDGWRISEVNSDVPGGFTEASFFTGLIAAQYPEAKPAGNPVEHWADAIVAKAGSNGKVSLLSAPGFMEDHQIMAYLAGHLQKRGCATHLANPGQLRWHDGFANLETEWFSGRLDAVVRFYQAEWLPSHSHQCGWTHFFRGGHTPVANPGCAVISESKRFPLVWDSLTTQLPIWRKALPQTLDVREAPWRTDESWIVKATISNTGDDVCIRELMTPRDWQWLRWRVRFEPHRWIAQRRFESVPIETPLGPMHVCVGVYTIDGVAAGAYVRLAKKALIDYSSVDAALLVENES